MATAKLAAKRKDNILKRFWKTRFLFLLFVPALLYYVLFKYVPIWGLRMAFYNYNLFQGFDSPFVGLGNFEFVLQNPDFWRIAENTLALGLQNLVFYFPLSIFFALMMNEIRGMRFKKVTQTVSYMPHFLSVVVVCSLINTLLDPTGIVNTLIVKLGGEATYFLLDADAFRPIMLISHTWSSLGWSTIVFLAAISSVDPALYEAARLDGAGRWRQILNITLPAIAPTVSTMLILQVGHILDSSMEKVLLLQTNSTKIYTAHTLGTYVYDLGFGATTSYGLATTVGLLTNIVNMTMLLLANWGSKKLTDSGIF